MDLTLASNLLGRTVERVSRVLDGGSSCAYRLAVREAADRADEAAGAVSPELSRTQSQLIDSAAGLR